MSEEEFLKLVNDYVRGHLCHSENWKYHCFSMVIDKCKDSGRTEIRIQYSPYRVENNETKEAKKTLVRNCDVFLTSKDCNAAYNKYVKWNMEKKFNNLAISSLEYEDWFFAEYNPKFYNN